MSANSYRSQLDRKNKARADAEKKAGDFRRTEAAKRAAAAKAQTAAAKATSPATIKTQSNAASRYTNQANAAAKDASTWEGKAAKFGQEAAALGARLANAEKAEREAADKARQREQKAAEQRAAAEQRKLESRLSTAEEQVNEVLKELRAPKPEKLRVLLLGADSDGGLRVGREQQRIRTAVQAATHRDLVELDVHPAATADILLDGLTRFRPHVVHFTGHSAEDLIEFERDIDDYHEPAIVSAEAFAFAIAAVDEPPLLVLLNSCNSAAQTEKLTSVVPFAIGMSDSIDDTDAIVYAARFYASVADGQSVQSAHLLGRAAVALNGLPDHDLPTLNWVSDVDPRNTRLVTPPAE